MAQPSPSSAAPRQFAAWLSFAGFALLALLAYWPCLRGELLWDDPAHVTRLGLQNLRGLARIWFEVGATQEYYPVLHSAFWFEHRLWGDAVMPYHVLNVLLHAANAALLASLMRRLGATPRVAWLGGALFTLHPACVESVAWITEQKNTLSLLFYLAAAQAYLDFAAKGGARRWLTAWILFLLALGAKTMTVTLPPALVVVAWWRYEKLEWRRDVRPLVPWFVTALLAGLVTSHVESSIVGAESVVPDLSLWHRVLLAARIFWFYIGTLLWPANLTFFYPLWDVAKEASGWIAGLVSGVALLALACACRHRSRAPLALLLLYGGTLFPVLGFFKVFGFSFSYVADHFPYLAIPIAIGAAAAGLRSLWNRITAPSALGTGLAVALVLGLGALTFRQSSLYQSDLVLFRANVAANPSSWMGHHVLAHALAKLPDRRAEAIEHYRRAMALSDRPEPRAALAALLVQEPGNREEAIRLLEEALRNRPTYAEAHVTLANELMADPSRRPGAIAHYETALRLRPKFGLALVGLAQALAQTPGRETEAIVRLEEALRVMPDVVPLHFHLANVLASQPSRALEAIAHYRQVLQLDPGSSLVHYNLANVLARTGDAGAAVEHYEAALRAEPNSAEIHANFANALATLPGRLPDAFTHYQRALELNPTLPWVHYNVALQLSRAAELADDALQHVEEAVRLKPDYLEALNLLGILHAQQGRPDQARAAWQRALQVDPNFEPARRNLGVLDARR